MSTITQKITHNVVVPSFIAMDKFVAWNAREVTALNPLAIAAWPVAQLAKLINKLILALFSSDILKHEATPDALKNKAAALLASKNKFEDILQHLPQDTLNLVDGKIYDAATQENVAGDDLTDPLFGQHVREASQPGDVRVQAAVTAVLSQI